MSKRINHGYMHVIKAKHKHEKEGCIHVFLGYFHSGCHIWNNNYHTHCKIRS